MASHSSSSNNNNNELDDAVRAGVGGYQQQPLDALDVEAARALMPHYMLPNFSSLLPEYANSETDFIRQAFSTANYTSILKLPARLGPQSVTQARLEQMEENRLGVEPPGKLVTKHGLFQAFEYTPSRFSLADELAQQERLRSEAKRLAISGKDFVSTNDPRRLKYEDAFHTPEYRYPHLAEPYPDTRDEERHRKWLEQKKILHGAFVPSGHRPEASLAADASGVVTRLVLPDLLQELLEVVRRDWPGVDVSVAPTEDENIAVRFSEATIESESGLVAYMNVLARAHHVTAKYRLHKVPEDWNAKPGDGGLYFVFRPPWVRNASRDAVVVLTSPLSTTTTTTTTRF
ncbi:hypothetical protein PINS_up013802 [Pythium insidiosum]|nr:hypothetical protein PINS_up013802 [Pythium insidiosum]